MRAARRGIPLSDEEVLRQAMSDLNDPRVFFAAERTLLAWNRTSLTVMAFGFVVERFGLFLHVMTQKQGEALLRGVSFWVGAAFILLGVATAILSVVQFRSVLKTLKPVEIPQGYWVDLGVFTNVAVAILGLAMVVYLFSGLG
jgi:putative membrane protein